MKAINESHGSLYQEYDFLIEAIYNNYIKNYNFYGDELINKCFKLPSSYNFLLPIQDVRFTLFQGRKERGFWNSKNKVMGLNLNILLDKHLSITVITHELTHLFNSTNGMSKKNIKFSELNKLGFKGGKYEKIFYYFAPTEINARISSFITELKNPKSVIRSKIFLTAIFGNFDNLNMVAQSVIKYSNALLLENMADCLEFIKNESNANLEANYKKFLSMYQCGNSSDEDSFESAILGDELISTLLFFQSNRMFGIPDNAIAKIMRNPNLYKTYLDKIYNTLLYRFNYMKQKCYTVLYDVLSVIKSEMEEDAKVAVNTSDDEEEMDYENA